MGEATPDLLLPLKRRRFRQPSPHRRVAGPFRLWLIGTAYRPSDGGGLHRSCLRTIFSRRRQATPAWFTSGDPLDRSCGGRFGLPSTLHPRAVTGVPHRPKCRLPKSPCLAPTPRRLLRSSRWRRAGCLPPPVLARFGQGVLYGCGSAQVGFGRRLSSFHDLTLSSKGILSPDPLRLTQRVRERPGKPATPSPLSRWGRFPTFTGVRVSHRATPTEVAPSRGITRRA